MSKFLSDSKRAETKKTSNNSMEKVHLSETKIQGESSRTYSILKILRPWIVILVIMAIVQMFIGSAPTSGTVFTYTLLLNILYFGFALSTTALLAVTGEVFNQSSGTINLGIEGTMGIGAFVSFFVAFTTGNLVLAIFAAAIVGGLMSLVLAISTITLKVNQALTGLAITIIATGIGGYLYFTIFGASGQIPSITVLEPLLIPILSDIPIWGYVFFSQTPLTYLAVIVAIVGEIVLNRSRLGIQIKVCGQDPEAAEVVGINVNQVRYAATIFGGIMAGLAGSYLSLNTGFYREYIVGGRGWIAFALARLSGTSPIMAIFASLIFGLSDAFQLRLQTISGVLIPYEFLWLMPYMIALIAIIIFSIRTKMIRGE